MKIINSLDDTMLKKNDTILLLDDCIYSGEQMRTTIEYMNNNRKLPLNIILFVPFISVNGLDKILKEFASNESLHDICNFKLCDKVYYIKNNTSYYLGEKEIDDVNNMYGNYFDIKDLYLIYFDHKLADGVSTIPLFYSGLVPNIHNKNILSNSTFQTSDIDKLLFIPFINNCQNIRNFNSNVPECPYPIYKQTGFIKTINKIYQNSKKPLSFTTSHKKLKTYSFKSF